MSRRLQVNDSALRQALLQASDVELGFERAVHDQIMQAVRVTPQRRSWVKGISIGPRSLALLAVLALLIAGVGLLAVGSVRRPAPAPPMEIYHHNGVILTLNSQLFGVSAPDGSPLSAALQVPPVRPGQASWSPDGNQLAVSGPDGVQIGDLASGSVRTIWTCDGACGPSEWAPDGKSIAVADSNVVVLLSPIGSEIGTFMLGGHTVDDLSWSPDSSRLVVAVDQPVPELADGADSPVAHGTSGLLIVDRHGALIRQLNAVQGDGWGIWDVDWSPDGRSIAYIAGHWRRECCTFEFSLVTIRPDGDGKRVLANAGGCYCAGLAPAGVAWSPDGTLIALGNAGKGLFVIRPDGSHQRLVSQNYYSPAWRPVP